MPGATFLMDDVFAAFGVRASDGAMSLSAGNPRRLTSATAAFKTTDVGKRIRVEGAGAAGVDLNSVIARRISATQVELQDPALTGVIGADISYVKGVYRLSQLIAQGDVDGNHYEFLHARQIRISLGVASPGGSVFIGGPYVTPTNHGIQIDANEEVEMQPGGGVLVTSQDYLTSATDNQKVNIYWTEDFAISTPAP